MGAWKQAIIKILGHLFELDQKKRLKFVSEGILMFIVCFF